MSSGSTADKPITILLGKYYKKERNAWDRVLLEDPLDPPEPEWIPPAINHASTGVLIYNQATTGVLIYNQATTSAMTSLQLREDREVIAAINYVVDRGTSTSLGQNGDDSQSTAYRGGNLPPVSLPPYAQGLAPWPRNGKERRILKALGKGFQAALQKAEQVLGSRLDTRNMAEWNSRFWEFVSRPSPKSLDKGRRK